MNDPNSVARLILTRFIRLRPGPCVHLARASSRFYVVVWMSEPCFNTLITINGKQVVPCHLI